MTRVHFLKTDPDVFGYVWIGQKSFEIRKNDRNYYPGDILLLRETKYSGHQMKNGKPMRYTGRWISVRVSYVLRGPIYGLEDGWVIMSIEPAPSKGEQLSIAWMQELMSEVKP